MTQHIQHFGKAMTAIAAVLAFSTAPSFAQDTGTPPDTVDTSVQTQKTVDPLAPEPATDTAVPPAPKPKVETTTAAATPRSKPSASASAARSTAWRANAIAPTVASAAPAAQTAQPTPPPAEPLPPTTAEPAAPPVAEPAPASANPEMSMSGLMSDEMLPIAGGAALGLIALAGAGIAMRRRKRRREDEEFEARQQALDMAEAEATEAEPPTLELDRSNEVRTEPMFVRAATPIQDGPIHDPVPGRKAPAASQPTTLPNGFDLSRFGPHVQAAYRGPTADNPSVSLEYRVRRAAVLDEQESEPAEER